MNIELIKLDYMDMITQTLTSTDILNIFIEQHRLTSPFDPEAEPNIKLSFDSTIADWREANDLLPWRPLFEFLNKEFQMSLSEKEWKSVLTPPSERTLRDVCELISNNYSRDNIVPVKILGQECLSASVFLTLKKNLKRRGVDISEIKPSTKLSPYLDKYYSEMMEQITILPKGKTVLTQFDITVERGDRTKKGLARLLSFLTKVRVDVETGDIKTFRDLTLKIIEVNNPSN